MKYLITVLLFMANALTATENKVVIYCDEQGPPFSYGENGLAKGIYIDIVREASKLISDYQVEIQPVPWKRGLDSVEKGKIFAILPPYKVASRTYIEKYSEAILEEDISIFCKNESLTKLTGPTKFPDSFSNVIIGVNSGYALGDTFESAEKNKLIQVNHAKTNEANITKLGLGRIDCYAMNAFAFYWTLNQMKKSNSSTSFNNFQFTKVATISKELGYLGYSRNFQAPFKEDFSRQMNSAIKKIKSSKKFEEIISHYSL